MSKVVRGDFESEPEGEESRKREGNGDNRLRDYRLDKLEERMEKLEQKTEALKTSVDTLPERLLKWMIPTLIALAGAVFALIKAWP